MQFKEFEVEAPNQGGRQNNFNWNLIFNKKNPMTHSQSAKKYRLCNKGIIPKRLKIVTTYIEEKVQKLFKLGNHKNGYRYYSNNNEKFIIGAIILTSTKSSRNHYYYF